MPRRAKKNSTRGKTRVLSISVAEIREGDGRHTALSVVLGHDGTRDIGAALLGHVLTRERASGVRSSCGCGETGARSMSDLRKHVGNFSTLKRLFT